MTDLKGKVLSWYKYLLRYGALFSACITCNTIAFTTLELNFNIANPGGAFSGQRSSTVWVEESAPFCLVCVNFLRYSPSWGYLTMILPIVLFSYATENLYCDQVRYLLFLVFSIPSKSLKNEIVVAERTINIWCIFWHKNIGHKFCRLPQHLSNSH